MPPKRIDMADAIGTPDANPRRNRNEAAEYIGCSPETLATWASRGGGPPYLRIGRKVVYLQSDLDVWMASRRVTCTAELSESE